METEKLYQICAYGRYKYFENGTGKIFSNTVYRQNPSEEEISNFIQKCCFSKDDNNCFSDLDISDVKTIIIELTVK